MSHTTQEPPSVIAKGNEIIGQLAEKIENLKTSLQYRHTRVKYYGDGLGLDGQRDFFAEILTDLEAMEEHLPELTYEFEGLENQINEKENENGK